ncbi:MAG: hypothetical protein ACJAW1_003386 [Glaciecola sp.]
MPKLLLLISGLLLLQACGHPLEIVGEGDIVDLNGSDHGCTLEQFQLQDEACTKNTVVFDYDVNFQAIPREGWTFIGWDGVCKDKGTATCRLKVPASGVKLNWFKVMPATVAVFELTSPAEGLWVGITDSGRGVQGLVLDDGTYYFIYTDLEQLYVGGVFIGSSSVSGSAFNSSNGKDFNLEGLGVLNATVSGTISPNQTFNSGVSYGSEFLPSSFTSTYSDDYDLTPSLASLAGTFVGDVAFSLGYENASLTIGTDGFITGESSGGCSFIGRTYPRASGNVFNVTITFGGSPCYFSNETFEGIIYYNASGNYIYSVTPNSSRSDGVLFFGSKIR